MNNEEYLKQLAETEKQNKRTELERSRTDATLASETEQKKLAPTFTKAKQSANVKSQLGAKNLAEFWARRGQTNQGISAQAELSRQNVLGRDIGDINQQRATSNLGFREDRQGINRQFQGDLAQGLGAIDENLQANLYDERLRQQAAAEARRNAYASSSNSTPKSQTLKGVLIPHDYAVQNQIKGVPISSTTMRYQVGNDFVDMPKGTNPFTGTENKDTYITTKGKYGDKDTTVLSVFSNGYQPNNVAGNKLRKTLTSGNVNGQEQNVWYEGTNYYFWDGANNKYQKLNSQEIKDLGVLRPFNK